MKGNIFILVFFLCSVVNAGKVKTYSATTDLPNGYNQSKLSKEVSDSGHVTGFDGLNVEGDSVDVLGASIADQAGLNAVFSNHVASSLAENKTVRHAEVEAKTKELLDNGSFTYNGKTFRLSDRAIIRWVGVSNADMKNLIGFPYTITTKNYEPYEISSKADWTAFFGTGLSTAEAIEGAGRALHAAINAATTQAALDAVVDTR